MVLYQFAAVYRKNLVKVAMAIPSSDATEGIVQSGFILTALQAERSGVAMVAKYNLVLPEMVTILSMDRVVMEVKQ